MVKDADNRAGNTVNLWDALFGEMGRAIADARDKVVLEPWFGPGGGGGDGGSSHSPATQSVAEELGWVTSDRDKAAPPSPAPDHGHGLDFER